MFLMYVDESGDPGLTGSPSRYFVLTGLVLHELRWKDYLDSLIDFRRRLKVTYGLRLRDEIHAAAFITHPGDLIHRIKRHERLAIIRQFASKLSGMTELSLICVVVDKSTKQDPYSVFNNAWITLIQRFENTISRRNFPGPANADERGTIYCDQTDIGRLTKLTRKMSRFNPIPEQRRGPSITAGGYRDLPLRHIIEDPSVRNSKHSLFIQAVDLAAFLLYQSLSPGKYMKSKNGDRYFSRFAPILCRVASSSDPDGIVRL